MVSGISARVHKADIAALVVLMVGVLWRWVGRPETVVNLHPFRQTQTLWPIREYMDEGWSLATPLPVFGPPWNVPFEFPLFQGLTALLASVTSWDAEPAARLMSLVFFFLTGVALLYTVRIWFGIVASFSATVLFVLSPFANQWAAATLMEYLPVSLIMGALAVLVWQKTTGRGFWPAVLAASVLISGAGLVKITTLIPWIPLLAVAIAMAAGVKAWRKISTSLAVLILPAFALTLLWTRYADGIKSQSELTQWLQSSNLAEWNFGTLSQRLVVDNSVTILDRLPSLGAPVAVWLVALLIAGVATRWSWNFVALAAVPIIAVGTFFNLYLVHDYYLVAVSPSYAAVLGIAVASVFGWITNERARVGFLITALPLLLATSLFSSEGLRLAEVWRTPTFVPTLSTNIAEVTAGDDVVLLLDCDWDPTVLYYAGRRGVLVPVSWEGPVPEESLDVVTHVAVCTGLYEPGSGIPENAVPESWVMEPVNPGVWRVDRK